MKMFLPDIDLNVTKKRKKNKPIWSLSEKQFEEIKEKDNEKTVQFIDDFDYDTFIKEVEVTEFSFNKIKILI